jgi:AraC-like DNA-binding protein
LALRARGGVELQVVRITERSFEPHFHDEYQIMVIVAGSVILEIEGADYAAKRGDVCVIAPRQVHGSRTSGAGWVGRILYPQAVLVDGVAAELGVDAPHFAHPVFSDPALASSLASAHIASGQEIDDMRQALALMITRYAANGPRRQAEVTTRAAERFIRAHFADKITLDQLAELCGYSRFHFLRVFAREWGLTPHAYQMQLRTAHALRLLRHGASAAPERSAAPTH